MSNALLTSVDPKARTAHRCIWCGEQIVIGEIYRSDTWAWDGKLQRQAWHLECHDDANESCGPGEFEFTAYSAERPTK